MKGLPFVFARLHVRNERPGDYGEAAKDFAHDERLVTRRLWRPLRQ